MSPVSWQPSVPPTMLCMIGYDTGPDDWAVGWWHGPPNNDGGGPLPLVQGINFRLGGSKPLAGMVLDLRDPTLPRFGWSASPRAGYVQLPISGDGKDLEIGGLFYEAPVYHFNRTVDSAQVWWQAYRMDGTLSDGLFEHLWYFEPSLAVVVAGHTDYFRGDKWQTRWVGSDHSGNAQGPGFGTEWGPVTIEAHTPTLSGNVTMVVNTFYGWLDDARDPFWTSGCNW
jgi:hypothetical protein